METRIEWKPLLIQAALTAVFVVIVLAIAHKLRNRLGARVATTGDNVGEELAA